MTREISKAYLVAYSSEYVPGTPITRDVIEALLVRVIGEAVGLIKFGWCHVGLEYMVEIVTEYKRGWRVRSKEALYLADLSDDGVQYFYADTVTPPPWQTKSLRVELDPDKLYFAYGLLHFIGHCTAKVTLLAVLKYALRIPLKDDEYLCTDFVQRHLTASMLNMPSTLHHWTPWQAVSYALDHNMTTSHEGEPCQILSITRLVPSVGRPTMWQYMFVGAVTALGAGHIIARAPTTC